MAHIVLTPLHKNKAWWLGVVVHACSPSTGEAKADHQSSRPVWTTSETLKKKKKGTLHCITCDPGSHGVLIKTSFFLRNKNQHRCNVTMPGTGSLVTPPILCSQGREANCRASQMEWGGDVLPGGQPDEELELSGFTSSGSHSPDLHLSMQAVPLCWLWEWTQNSGSRT